MPLTTMLHQCELDQPTGNDELDELLAEARQATGRNYQIVMRPRYERKRKGIFYVMLQTGTEAQVYVECAGVFPWQEMTCARDTRTARAYLLGLINGANEHVPPNT